MPPTSRQEPRISVNDLALYMVSSDTARMGIIKRAKFPSTVIVSRYRDVRRPVIAHLTDLSRSGQPLAAAEAMFAQRADDASQGPLRQDDARQSIEVLHSLQAMQNKLGAFRFTAASHDQPPLSVCGVEVSVRLDMIAHGVSRGVDQVGGTVLRLTQDDAETDSAKAKRRDMGVIVAILARMQLERNVRPVEQIANRLCMSIDIRHGEVFLAPTASTRRISDVENACRVIAALWPTIT